MYTFFPDKLPVEILDAILELCTAETLATLYSVSRRLRHHFQRSLDLDSLLSLHFPVEFTRAMFHRLRCDLKLLIGGAHAKKALCYSHAKLHVLELFAFASTAPQVLDFLLKNGWELDCDEESVGPYTGCDVVDFLFSKTTSETGLTLKIIVKACESTPLATFLSEMHGQKSLFITPAWAMSIYPRTTHWARNTPFDLTDFPAQWRIDAWLEYMPTRYVGDKGTWVWPCVATAISPEMRKEDADFWVANSWGIKSHVRGIRPVWTEVFSCGWRYFTIIMAKTSGMDLHVHQFDRDASRDPNKIYDLSFQNFFSQPPVSAHPFASYFELYSVAGPGWVQSCGRTTASWTQCARATLNLLTGDEWNAERFLASPKYKAFKQWISRPFAINNFSDGEGLRWAILLLFPFVEMFRESGMIELRYIDTWGDDGPAAPGTEQVEIDVRLYHLPNRFVSLWAHSTPVAPEREWTWKYHPPHIASPLIKVTAHRVPPTIVFPILGTPFRFTSAVPFNAPVVANSYIDNLLSNAQALGLTSEGKDYLTSVLREIYDLFDLQMPCHVAPITFPSDGARWIGLYMDLRQTHCASTGRYCPLRLGLKKAVRDRCGELRVIFVFIGNDHLVRSH